MASPAVVTSVVVRDVVRDQERRQLLENVEEGGALLSSSLGSLTSGLNLLATRPDPEADLAAFADGQAVTVARVLDGNYAVTATTGRPSVGVRLDAGHASLARRAVGAHGMVSATLHEGGVATVAVAVEAPAAHAVLLQSLPFDPSKPVALGGLFTELDGAVYTVPRADPAHLALTSTAQLPVAGRVVQHVEITVGADRWLLVATPKVSLVGSFAATMHWYLLAGGLVSALLVSALVEVLVRRRAYAMRLVDQRTGRLRTSLAEQERLSEEADAANRAKSEFLSRMSHELRTPLNAVLGFAQLLDLDELDQSQQEAVDQILRGGRHLLDLINEVLDIAAIESGHLSLSSEPVSAAEVIAEVVDLTQPLATNAGITLVGDASLSPALHLLADHQRLKQVLLNLVSNGIKYNREGGTVSVTCEPGGAGRYRIVVTDTGHGIAAADLERAFVPFERLGAEQTATEGSGIGLALALRLAEAMGGTLTASSELGSGSTFQVELPVVEGPVEAFDRVHADLPAVEPEPRSAMRTILYIEDNLSNLRLVERVLTRDGSFDLLPAMQGRIGIELAREHRPALILLDMHLPDIPGDQVLAELQADERTAGIPVIVISADATTRQIDRMAAAGAAAYLTKPLDVAELARVLAITADVSA